MRLSADGSDLQCPNGVKAFYVLKGVIKAKWIVGNRKPNIFPRLTIAQW
jgi:hypothetical protein